MEVRKRLTGTWENGREFSCKCCTLIGRSQLSEMLESDDFLRGQVAEVPSGKAFAREPGVQHAIQAEYLVPELFKKASQDAVFARVNLNAQFVALLVHEIEAVDFCNAVIEHHPLQNGFKIASREVAVQFDMV